MGSIYFMPRSRLGAWSVRFALVFIVVLTVFYRLLARGQSESVLALLTTVAGIFGLAAGVTGAAALSKGDRAVPLVLTVVLGVFVSFFVICLPDRLLIPPGAHTRKYGNMAR